jgi:hypothetical protein
MVAYEKILKKYLVEQEMVAGTPTLHPDLPLYSIASLKKDERSDDWLQLIELIREKIKPSRFRSFFDNNMFSATAMFGLEIDVREGVFLSVSFTAELFGFYFFHEAQLSGSKVVSQQHAEPYHPRLSYFPYTALQASTANAIGDLVVQQFPSFQPFDNQFAEEPVTEAYHGYPVYDTDLFQAVLGTVIVGDII